MATKNFGNAEFVTSVQLKNTVLNYKSTVNEDLYYNFRKKNEKKLRNGKTNEYWICLDCERQITGNFKLQFCKVKTCGGRIITNPDIGHHKNCNGRTFAMVEASKLSREARSKCRMGKQPIESHAEMMSKLNSSFQDERQRKIVKALLPKYKHVKKGFHRWSKRAQIQTINSASQVEEVQTTIAASFQEETPPIEDSEKENSTTQLKNWLFVQSSDDDVSAFMSEQDIKVMHGSTNLIIYGCCKMFPNGSVQVYTIFAWGCFEYEAVPVCHAVIRSKKMESYIYLFEKIRAQLIGVGGGIGSLKTAILDFEINVYLAFSQVFPEIVTKGCNFHFNRELETKLRALAPSEILEDLGDFGEWIGSIKALSLIPPVLIPTAFDSIRRHTPASDNENVANALTSFSEYFENSWINGLFPVSMWNHWHNDGPVTINLTEEYHDQFNSLETKTSRFSMDSFLELLQPLHDRDQLRINNLRNGSCQPSARNIAEIDLECRIADAKKYFRQRTIYFWPHLTTIDLHPSLRYDLEREIHFYALYVRHFVGRENLVAVSNE